MSTIPLILDTDIGSDIDDAVCLAYLLKQPRCEFLGVTTVSGDTAQRAALAGVICEAAGRGDVPIHAGAPGPLVPGVGPGQPNVPQYQAIAARPHRREFPPGTALDFIRRTVRARPGQVTLLAIGPLTNLALLFTLDPQVPALLKELVLMCGVFTPGLAPGVVGGAASGIADWARGGFGPGYREWNARCDPMATAVVYRTALPRFTSIGLEVTTRCVLPADECRRRFAKAGGPLGIVADLAEVWYKHAPQITFHDPLAGATVFEPSLCEYAEGQVTIETASAALAGLTAFDPRGDSKPHRVAVSVDAPRFFEHYFGIVGG
jgi:purine nucleosidase